MAEADRREALEEDADETQFRLRLLREELVRVQNKIDWELEAFVLRNPECRGRIEG